MLFLNLCHCNVCLHYLSGFCRPCFECKVVALISTDNQFTMGVFYYLEDSEALKFNSLQLSLCQESTFWLYQRAGLLDKQIKCYASSIVWFWGTQIRSSIRSFSIIMVPPCPTTTRLFSSRYALIYKQNDFQFYRKSFIMVWQKIINTLCNKICCYCAWICS